MAGLFLIRRSSVTAVSNKQFKLASLMLSTLSLPQNLLLIKAITTLMALLSPLAHFNPSLALSWLLLLLLLLKPPLLRELLA